MFEKPARQSFTGDFSKAELYTAEPLAKRGPCIRWECRCSCRGGISHAATPWRCPSLLAGGPSVGHSLAPAVCWRAEGPWALLGVGGLVVNAPAPSHLSPSERQTAGLSQGPVLVCNGSSADMSGAASRLASGTSVPALLWMGVEVGDGTQAFVVSPVQSIVWKFSCAYCPFAPSFLCVLFPGFWQPQLN